MSQKLLDVLMEAGISEDELRSEVDVWSASEYLVDLVCNCEAISDEETDDWEFKSIEQLARESFTRDLSPDWVNTRVGRVLAISALVKKFAHRFAQAIDCWAWYEEEGLPLYVKDGEGFKLADASSADWLYLKLASRQGGVWGDSYFVPPPWSQNLYVNRVAYEVYGYIWNDSPDEESVRVRRKRERAEAVRLLLERHSVPGFCGQVRPNDTSFFADHPNKPPELDLALIAWRTACTQCPEGVRPGKFIREWLSENYPTLSTEAIDRIGTVANWDKSPGAGKKIPR